MASELIDHSASTSEVMKFGGAPHQPPSAAPMFCADGALEAAVRRILGPGVIAQLANPALQELSANYDPAARMCRLFIDDGQGPMRPLDALIQPSAGAITLTSSPTHKIILRCDEAETAKWASDLLGSREVERLNMTQLAGLSTMREGINLQPQRTNEHIVTPAEIQLLQPFHGYLCIAGFDRTIIQIPERYLERKQPAFLPRSKPLPPPPLQSMQPRRLPSLGNEGI